MPTLQRRDDGGFFVRHLYREFNTWQILGDGVRYLERRGISEGNWFPTEMFMDLWMQCLVYYGDTPPKRPVVIPQDTAPMATLRSRVKEFYQLIYSVEADLAWALVWRDASSTRTLEQFGKEISGGDTRRLAAWNIKDIIACPVPVDSQSAIGGAKRFAVVTVQINWQASASGQRHPCEVKHFWLELNGQWWIIWNGFGT